MRLGLFRCKESSPRIFSNRLMRHDNKFTDK